MKIAIDASRYGFGFSTGVEWYSFHIINGLLKNIDFTKGNSIYLYTNNCNFSLEESVEKFIKEKELDVQVRYVRGRRFWTLFHFGLALKKDEVDLLFVPSHTFPLFLPKYSVIMIHDLVFKRYKKAYSFIQRLYLNWSTKFAVKHASKILVPSNATKKDLIEFFKCPSKKIETVYHGFSGEILNENEIKDSPVLKHLEESKFINGKNKFIFFMGRVETKKNVLNMIKAFQKVNFKYPNIKFVLSGKRGFGFKKILKYCEDNNLMDHVFFTGYISESEKNYLYKNAYALFFATLFEGFGLPILEAFYHKTPVITSNVGSQKEIAGNSAILVDPNSILEMAEALLKLVEKDDVYRNCVENGLKTLNSFNWEMSAEESSNILTKFNEK